MNADTPRRHSTRIHLSRIVYFAAQSVMEELDKRGTVVAVHTVHETMRSKWEINT